MSSAYSADYTSYERSNDESLHLAHSRNPHQLSSGASSVEGQRSCNTYAPPQIPSASTHSASLFPGQTTSTYHSSPAAAVGYFPPLNLSVTLPQMPYPQPVPLQIMVQPSVGIGNAPQLNISINLSQIPSAVPHSSFQTWPGQLQIQNQPPSEPALWNVLQSDDRNRLHQIPSNSMLGAVSTSTYPGQIHSTESRSLDTAFGNWQQSYDSSVIAQLPWTGQQQRPTSQSLKGGSISTSEIYTSSMGSGQSQSTNLPSFGSVSGSLTLSSRLGSTNETHFLSPNDSGSHLSPVYPGQQQTTYQPPVDPAYFGEQIYGHSIPYQALGAVVAHSQTPQEMNNGIGPISEVYSFDPAVYSEELQSTYLSSFQPAFDYPRESSVSQMSSSALGSVNQDHSCSPNYRGSHPCEIFYPLAVSDSQQITSPLDMIPSLKHTADEICPSGSELVRSGQSETAPSFEDVPRPRKRLKEADTVSACCVPKDMMQSLIATADDEDLHTPETFLDDDCGIPHDQRMDTPVQQSIALETRNDTSMFRGAHGFSIRGNPTFTTIGVNNHSGAHDLEILTKFVSFDAIHDSSIQDPDRRCHPGTRVNVLARLQGWTDDPSASERIIWLHGLPGAGKSSIAQTIIRKCGREKMVATFFFYRSDPSRNDGNCLFTTIAWQLASSIPGVKSYLVDSLIHRPDLPMKDIETQFEELVVQPFHALKDAASHLELPLAPVVVIDGVDECTDEKLQRRLLNVIGNAIRDRRVPLRFLILSRPEAHIKKAVDQFECPTLYIDLDSIDNVNHDIELYFNAEFSRIGDERDFDAAWPGRPVIQRLVCNSSGQFVYAATIIKYVGDAYNCAKAQLDIILGLRKRPSASPFAPLDELYTAILKRQPDQDFLKDVLGLLVACSSIEYDRFSDDDGLDSDFPILLNISEEEMGRKLCGMQSLLAFEEGHTDFHHQSFLDFLQDVSRSGRYHISQQASSRRYLELITDAIVRYVSDAIDQSHCHDMQHLHLEYPHTASGWPLEPSLAVEDLREILQPLLDLQDKLLNLPNFTSIRELPPCNQCNVFEMMRDLLLHLALNQAKSYSNPSSRTTGPLMFEHEGDYGTSAALPKIEAESNDSDKDLDRHFASLLAYMPNIPSTFSRSSPTLSVLELMYSLLHFDCSEIAKKVCSVLDAQNLVNLADYIIHDQNTVKNGGINLTCKAILLVLGIYARVPVLPDSLRILPYEGAHESTSELDSDDFGIENLCSRVLMIRVLNCRFIGSHGLIMERNDPPSSVCWAVDQIMDMNVSQQLRISKANHSTTLQVMLQLSKSIQYFHSVGAVLSCETTLDIISLNWVEFCPKFHISCLNINGVMLNEYTYESSVFTLGRLFYELYFKVRLRGSDRIELKRDVIVKHPPEPEIHEDAWGLIQRCCADDPEIRPTIDEVVQEIESWGVESKIATLPSSKHQRLLH